MVLCLELLGDVTGLVFILWAGVTSIHHSVFFQCTGPFSLLARSFQVETQMLSDEIFLIKYSYSYLSLDFGDYTTAIVFVKKKKKSH